MRIWRLPLLARALSLGLGIPGALLAQQGEWKSTEIRTTDGESCRLGYRALIGAIRPGGYGFAEFRITNTGSRAHRLTVYVEDTNADSYFGSAEVDVDPRGVATVRLILPQIASYMRVSAAIDGGAKRTLDHWSNRSGSGISVLAVVRPGSSPSSWQAMLDACLSGIERTGRVPVQVETIALLDADQLPDDWRLISGFDIAVVDGSLATLDQTAQAPLADFVLAGGSLVLLGADGVRPGRLADLVDDPFHGLGRLLLLDSDTSAGLPAAIPAATSGVLLDFLQDGENAPLSRLEFTVSGPIHPAFAVGREIPGIGRPPLRGFLFVILAFAVLVGPVNHFVCKRKRRMHLLLLTVPAGGIAATLLILLWGLLAQGFDVKQAECWITMLDQTTRRAASWGTRTLFAGTAIDRLHPRAGTWVWNASAIPYSGEAIAILRPLQDGSIEGGLVPSRMLTTLAEATVGPERARMRFRRDGRAREVLVDGDFAPIGAGILLRDLDGNYFAGAGGSRLDPIDAGDASVRLDELAMGLQMPEAAPIRSRFGGFATLGQHGWSPKDFVRAQAGGGAGGALRAGTYVALVVRSPGADDLGVKTTTLAGSHLVIGRIGPEDIVD